MRCTGIVYQPEFPNQNRPSQSRDRRRYANENRKGIQIMSDDHPNIALLKRVDPANVAETIDVFAEDVVFHYINPLPGHRDGLLKYGSEFSCPGRLLHCNSQRFISVAALCRTPDFTM